jgi:hypothetical protein
MQRRLGDVGDTGVLDPQRGEVARDVKPQTGAVELDAIVRFECRPGLEPAARAALLRQAEALAMREQALIPLYHHAARNLVGPRVLGWRDNMLDVNRSRYLGLAAQDAG